jgi:hypothetical protein
MHPTTLPPVEDKDRAYKRDLDRQREEFQKQLDEEVRISESRERKILLAHDRTKKTNADQQIRLATLEGKLVTLEAQYSKVNSAL